MLIFGKWISDEMLYPTPYRQYVFTIPKILRPHFRFDRKLLGKQLAYQCIKEFFRQTLRNSMIHDFVNDGVENSRVTNQGR